MRFGAFALDTTRRELSRDGAAVHLTPKAFDLLALLAAEAPRIITKTELHARLWSGTFVSEATLTGLVKEIRRALDDRARRRDSYAPLIASDTGSVARYTSARDSRAVPGTGWSSLTAASYFTRVKTSSGATRSPTSASRLPPCRGATPAS